MSIVRLVVVDPRPRKGESDIRVYQVPEKSREMELLVELFNDAGIEHASYLAFQLMEDEYADKERQKRLAIRLDFDLEERADGTQE